MNAAEILDLRAVEIRKFCGTINQFINSFPEGMWAIATRTHWIAYSKGMVADSGAWFSRKPQYWDGKTKAKARINAAIRYEKVR